MSLSKACPKCGSENFVKNGRLHRRQRKYAISHLQTPPLLLALAPPPARLPIDPLFPRPLRLMICFVRHRLWYLLPIVPAPKPGIFLYETATPSSLLHHAIASPIVRNCLHHPPLLLLRPYLWPYSLSCTSLPPLYSPPHTTSPTATHMRYAPHLFHPLQSLPSPQHPQRLPSLGCPSPSTSCL
jgi:hypothetical protein